MASLEPLELQFREVKCCFHFCQAHGEVLINKRQNAFSFLLQILQLQLMQHPIQSHSQAHLRSLFSTRQHSMNTDVEHSVDLCSK